MRRTAWLAALAGGFVVAAAAVAAQATVRGGRYPEGPREVLVAQMAPREPGHAGPIAVRDLISGKEWQIGAPDDELLRPRWSPDGNRLAAFRFSPDEAGPVEVVLFDRDGREVAVLGRLFPHDLTWSPAGLLLITGLNHLDEDEHRRGVAWLFTPGGQRLAAEEWVVDPEPAATSGNVVWSPDGRRGLTVMYGQPVWIDGRQIKLLERWQDGLWGAVIWTERGPLVQNSRVPPPASLFVLDTASLRLAAATEATLIAAVERTSPAHARARVEEVLSTTTRGLGRTADDSGWVYAEAWRGDATSTSSKVEALLVADDGTLWRFSVRADAAQGWGVTVVVR